VPPSVGAADPLLGYPPRTIAALSGALIAGELEAAGEEW